MKPVQLFELKKHPWAAIFLFPLMNLALINQSHAKLAPGLAGTFSLVPGLGQVTNGDRLEGLAWFGTIVGGLVATQGRGSWPATAFLDLWMYNMYDAYRDAGAKKSAKYSLLSNYFATFNPLNIIDPIGAPLLTVKALSPSSGLQIGPDNKILTPFAMGFIALGEEGLFRGFLFPGISDIFNNTIVGAGLSSFIFAAAHAAYQGQSSYALQGSVLAQRTVLGLLWCWQTHRQNYDLRKSIFSHAWFDVIYEYKRAGGEVSFQRGPSMFEASNHSEPTGWGLRVGFEFD